MKVPPAREGEEGFRLSPEDQTLLLDSIAQAERGEVVDGWQLLEELWELNEEPPTGS